MGEHKRAPTMSAGRWDYIKSLKPRFRYVWRSNQGRGTFVYHEKVPGIYGALKTRRMYKIIRLQLKKALNGRDRLEVMRNVMGKDE